MNNIAEQKILTAEAKGGYTASSDSEKDWQKITIIDATSSSLSDDGDDNDDNETDDDDDDHKIEEKMITPEGKAFKDEVLKQEEFLLPITIYISATPQEVDYRLTYQAEGDTRWSTVTSDLLVSDEKPKNLLMGLRLFYYELATVDSKAGKKIQLK